MDDSALRERNDENMIADVVCLIRGGWDLKVILSQLKPRYPKLSRDGIREIIKSNALSGQYVKPDRRFAMNK